MELRNLGRSGLRVSVVGVGCNNFGERIDLEAARKVVHRALDLGITLFDTADVYGGRGGSETALGQILGERRKDVVLATKFGMPMDGEGRKSGAARRYIMQAVEDSLRRLQTDWIDLYQVHRPDPMTPIEETLRTLDDLITSGKVRYIGSSNFAGWQTAEAEFIARQAGWERFASVQEEYSLLTRAIEKEVLPAARAYGLGLLPYFPLASGLLTGKYKRGETPPAGTRMGNWQRYSESYLTDANFDRVEKLTAFAEERGHTLLELAFSWLAAQPVVASVIAGATRPEQVDQNIAAVTWALTGEDLAEIDRLVPAE